MSMYWIRDIYGKNISLMKINNIMLHTRIIFSVICHSGSFPFRIGWCGLESASLEIKHMDT